MNNWRIYWFFTHIFTARRLYKSFGVKGLAEAQIKPAFRKKAKFQKCHIDTQIAFRSAALIFSWYYRRRLQTISRVSDIATGKIA
jgi:hypothetical protein